MTYNLILLTAITENLFDNFSLTPSPMINLKDNILTLRLHILIHTIQLHDIDSI